tara:strand:- start:1018 stop:1302 length:285 start_codon:yes stop_codon:yes gene_type:complete
VLLESTQKHLFSGGNGGRKKGRVISHEDSIHLEDVSFKVSESGRQGVLRDRVKNIHAYVVGTLVLDREKLWSFGKSDERVVKKADIRIRINRGE